MQNYTVSGNDLTLPLNYTKPAVTDGVDENITTHCNPETLNTIGQIIIHCTASDESGNTATTSFVVTVPLDVMYTLESITTDSCSISVQFGTTKTFSLEQCDSDYAGVTYSSIPRSAYYGSVAISADKTTLLITAPDLRTSHPHADAFGVTINAKTYNTPRIDVSVTYYE